MNVWWCNQNEYWNSERSKGVIAASAHPWHPGRKNAQEIRRGDVTIHYHSPDQEIRAVSLALEDYRVSDRTTEELPRLREGDAMELWMAKVRYHDFPSIGFSTSSPLRAELREAVPGLFQGRAGGAYIQQVYLYRLGEPGLRLLLRHAPGRLPPWLP